MSRGVTCRGATLGCNSLQVHIIVKSINKPLQVSPHFLIVAHGATPGRVVSPFHVEGRDLL